MKTLADIVVDFVVALETASDEEINLDTAVKLMEWIAADIKTLDRAEFQEVLDAAQRRSKESDDPEIATICRDFGRDVLMIDDESE